MSEFVANTFAICRRAASLKSQRVIIEKSIVLEFINSNFMKVASYFILSENTLNIFDIAMESQDVSINMDKVFNLAKWIAYETISEYTNPNINHRNSMNCSIRHEEFYPTVCESRTLDWLFMLNALNFSLWNPKDTKQWTVCGQTGFKALYSAIKRAIDVEGKPLWSPAYYSEITLEELKIIFRSDDNETTIPLIEERAVVLHEIGTVLLHKFEGSFVNCVKYCQGDGVRLLYLLMDTFKAYRDTVKYKGKEVFLGSKAANLIADLKRFNKVSRHAGYIVSTMFTDYRSPQVFVRFGILSYSDKFMTRLTGNNEPLKFGSGKDIEIRCCSLFAFFMLVYTTSKIVYDSLIEKTPEIRILNFQTIIDNFIWLHRHNHDKHIYDNMPLHNISSVYY